MTRSMLDAAWPPSQPPKVDAVAGYIGGGTPHVWTAQEWDDTLRKSGASFKLPIFVRVPPTTRDPHAEAQWCVNWARDHDQPAGTVIALDYETAVDPYWYAFDRTIQAGGYKTLLYGTLRTVVENVIHLPDGSSRYPSGGYWSAHWTNVPHICANPHVTATQYGGDVTIGQPWDISRVADSVPLWSTQGDADMPLTDDDVNKVANAVLAKLSGPAFMGKRWDPDSTGALTLTELLGKFEGTSLYKQLDAILAAVELGVSVDLSGASPQQVQDLGNAIADRLAVISVGYTLSLTGEATPKATP